MPNKLTEQQARFVEEYLRDLNATKAAVRAGYAARSARQQGARLLSHADIADAIRRGMDERSAWVKVDADRVVQELSHLGFYDAGELGAFPMKGPEDIAVLPERLRRAVIGWSWDKQGRCTIKLSPKTPSLELLGRHLGMFKDRPAGGGVTQVTVYLPDNGRK